MSLPVKFARRFSMAPDGAVSIYVALVSVVMIGFGALVVDLGRLFTLQTELQNAADAAALSGAAELDGSSTAITRARLAAKNTLISNRQTFATGGANVVIQDSDIRFLSSLPATDDDPITASNLTTDPFLAHFIEVRAPTRRIDYLLAPVLRFRIGGDGTGPTSGQADAVAVAGYNRVTCSYPVFMMCNPQEEGPSSSYVGVPGEVIELKAKGGNNSTWAPGNFGLIDPPGIPNAGSGDVADWIAKAGTGDCRGIEISQNTGSSTGPVEEGLNVRFDMFTGKFNNTKDKGRDNIPPAPNVTKAKYLDKKKFEPIDPADGLPMPTHPCFGDPNTCEGLTATNSPRFAPVLPDSQWDAYWAINHPDLNFYALKLSSNFDLDGDGVNGDPIDLDGDGNVSRWEMYNYENIAGEIPDNTSGGGGDSIETAENGNHKNYNGNIAGVTPERRIVSVAVVNCIDQDVHGGNSNSGKFLQPVAMARLFLVQAVEKGTDHAIFVEMLGKSGLGDTSPMRDIIQLYR